MSYKLIVIQTANGAELRFKKKDENHFSTLDLQGTDVDLLVENILKIVKD